MEQFNTIDAVSKLFESINCVGEENCYFVSYVDINASNPVLLGGILGGAVGAFAAGMVAGMEQNANGYIINQMEKGIALIPLNSTGIGNNIKKMIPNTNSYMYFGQSEIKSIKIKRAYLISAVVKKVRIELTDGKKFNLLVNVKEKYVPYHKENFEKFMQKYKKK